MSTFNPDTYQKSDARGKELAIEFLTQLGLKPKIYGEVFKDGDLEAHSPGLNRMVIFGAEYRGTETTDLNKHPWQEGPSEHPWRFVWSTVHLPGRKSQYDRTEIEISFDSKTDLNLTVILMRDAVGSIPTQTTSRGLDNLHHIPIQKVLVFHRSSLTDPWVMCNTCTARGDDEEPDSASTTFLKKALGLSVLN